MLAQFGARRSLAEQRYRQFVHDGRLMSAPWEHVRGQVVLGREQFVAQLKPLFLSKQTIQEIPRAQRLLSRPSLRTLFSSTPSTTRDQRNHTIWVAHVQHGYSLTAIGQQLGLHYSTISKIMQRKEQRHKS